MENKAFKAKKNPPGNPKDAVDEATIKAILQGGNFATWAELEDEWAYDPYFVRFDKRAGNSIEFKFVDCSKAPEVPVVGDTHTVSLTEIELVFPARPSTLPPDGTTAANPLFGFLMLNPDKLTNAHKKDIALSKAETTTAEGKWPRGAGIPVPLPPSAKLRLRKVIDLARGGGAPVDLGQLEEILSL